MSHSSSSPLRALPAVGRLLATPPIQRALQYLHRDRLVLALQEALNEARERIRTGEDAPDEQEIISRALALLKTSERPHLRSVVNATGVVLNTNLGRAILAERAIDRVLEMARRYSNLEYDLQEGKRGSRYDHVEELLCRLTGAEAALVVNNNAAAVLLVVDTFGRDREVIVSRGQLVEIGGSFRIPEVLTTSGACLVEVGTTNKTRPADYERAISERTAMLLRCHPSNYRIVGFTAEVSPQELVAIAQRHGVLAVEDLGSGVLIDLSTYGLPPEPTVQASVLAGMDLVTFSGDKLLGGPQAGIIVGKRDAISKLKGNPLLRALRVDKLSLAGLEQTLRLYQDPEKAREEIPVLEMLTRPLANLQQEATLLAEALMKFSWLTIEQLAGESQVGGGSLPETGLPTALIAVQAAGWTAQALCDFLRQAKDPVVARIEHEKILFDPRTLRPGDNERILAAFEELTP